MKCTINENKVSWERSGKEVSVQVSDIDQVLYSKDQNSIIVLAGPDQKSKKIHAFTTDGKVLCKIEQPSETYFNGLGPNRGRDVAIFATIYQIGWRDWWLSIDCEAAQVESLGEGR